MTYEEFRSDLLRKLEEKTNDLGYKEVKYYPDGFTSEDPADLSTIRNTNVKYHRLESDILKGDFVLLMVGTEHHQICRFSVSDLYEAFGQNGWESVWTIVNSHLAESKKYAELGIMELMQKNEYDALKDKLFIRPLNFNDHRFELKENVYRRVGDMVLVLYVLGNDVWDDERHNVMSMKMPRLMMEKWGRDEDEIWDSAMTNTYMMAPPRMYLNPMDAYKPPYYKGAFMALNSDIHSISPMSIPTITTTTQMNGAIAMFYPGVKERLAELFGGDYYVAFSSIHDVRLHKKGSMSPRQILQCIKDTNNMFDPKDILSRKVYLYEAATKELKQLVV